MFCSRDRHSQTFVSGQAARRNAVQRKRPHHAVDPPTSGRIRSLRQYKKLRCIQQNQSLISSPKESRFDKENLRPLPEVQRPQHIRPLKRDDGTTTSSHVMTISSPDTPLQPHGIRGQLKISMKLDGTALMLRVHSARQLCRDGRSGQTTFVQVEISGGNAQRGKSVLRCDQPVYEDEFRLELSGHDGRARLLIGVWRDEDSTRSEFVGGLSFGVKHLESKWSEAAGWYYLLKRQLAARKHLKLLRHGGDGEPVASSSRGHSSSTSSSSYYDRVTYEGVASLKSSLRSNGSASSPHHVYDVPTCDVTVPRKNSVKSTRSSTASIHSEPENPAKRRKSTKISSCSVRSVAVNQSETCLSPVVSDVEMTSPAPPLRVGKSEVATPSCRDLDAISPILYSSPCSPERTTSEAQLLEASKSKLSRLKDSALPLSPSSLMMSQTSMAVTKSSGLGVATLADSAFDSCLKGNSAMLSMKSSGMRTSSHLVSMNRSDSGYGFTITSSNPVRVARVQDAEDLCEGDEIVCVNGLDVSRMGGEAVGRLIRGSEHLELKLARSSCNSLNLAVSSCVSSALFEINNNNNNNNDDDGDDGNCDDESVTQKPPSPSRSAAHLPESVINPEANDITAIAEPDSLNTTRWVAGESSGRVEWSGTSELMQALLDQLGSESSLDLSSHYYTHDSPFLRASLQSPRRSTATQLTAILRVERNFTTRMAEATCRYVSPTHFNLLSSRQHQIVFQNVEKILAISEFHVKKLDSMKDYDVQQLLDVYEPRLTLMTEAYSIYCSGLSDSLSLLSRLQRNAIFVRFISSRSPQSGQLSLPEFLLHPIEHFEQLSILFNSLLATFERAERPSEANAEKGEIRLRVAKRLQSMVPRFNEMLPHVHKMQQTRSDSTTSSSHITSELDQAFIRHSEDASVGLTTSASSLFHSGVSGVTERNELTDVSSVMMSDRSDSCLLNQTLALSEWSFDSSARSTVLRADSDMLELEQKLLFPQLMKKFAIAIPNRQLVHSGDVSYKRGAVWKRVTAVLCSDLLLLTTRTRRERLLVESAPVSLHDVMHVHRSLPGAQFSVDVKHTVGNEQLRSVEFLAASVDDKHRWCTLLGTRTEATHRQTTHYL